MLHLGLKGLDHSSPEGIIRDALGRIRGPRNALREKFDRLRLVEPLT